MKQTPLTIKDIAKALKISPSTVSRALRNKPGISKKTRQLVQSYAKENNYKPNIMALNLRKKQSNTIGVIVPQLIHHFFSCVLSGIEQKAHEEGYNILVAQSNELYQKEVSIVHSFLEERVCGVITSLAKETKIYDHYNELLNHSIPIVFYDRICTEIQTERVVVDDYAGSYAAVEHMILTGCKRIFFYSASPHLEISKNRRNGYIDAMSKHKRPVTSDMIVYCDNRQQAMQITPTLLESNNRPDGFFAINDETASGILWACKKCGLSVPQEVSICGFTGGAIAQSTDPPLTTVDQFGEEVGEKAIELLLNRIKHGENLNSTNRIVRTKLLIRGTTKNIKI